MEALKELMATGRFPQPILVSPKTPRWRAEWIGLYLEWAELGARLTTKDGKPTDS